VLVIGAEREEPEEVRLGRRQRRTRAHRDQLEIYSSIECQCEKTNTNIGIYLLIKVGCQHVQVHIKYRGNYIQK
jgi:hypothetical protein